MANSKSALSTRKLILMSLFCALAYISVFVLRIPMVSFLDYEPKDVIITLAGLILGPISTIFISIVVSFIEMVTISDTGPIGMLMNVIASLSFALPVSFLYKYKRNINLAVMGLLIGTIAMTVSMILWNYLITPYYMGVPRPVVVDMLVPIFLPFNIIKATINSTLVFLLYKPIIFALRKSRSITNSKSEIEVSKRAIIIFNVCALFILLACIVIWILWRVNQK